MAKRRLSIRISTLLNVGIALVFVAVAAIIIALVNHDMRQQALVEAESKARILLDRNLATHTYFSQIMKPRLFEWTDPFRSADYFEPSWMSSTYAIRQIDKYFKSLSPSDYYFKDAAINARSPDNEADEYERAFLEELNADPQLEARSAVQTIGSQPYFVVLRCGEMMEESCLRCHGDPADAPGDLVRLYGAERSFHRQVGEVVSAVSIRVPLSAAYAEADRISTQLSALLLLLLGVLFAAQFWFYRRLLLKPVAVLRDKARQIASEEKHLGEEIPLPFGEELSELTASFNTMSTGLRQSRDHLEARVQDRTTDLQTANEQLQREIAERKRAEREIEERRLYLEGVLGAAPDAIVTLDAHHRIVEWNLGAERLFGYSREEVIGQNIDDLVTAPDVVEEAVGFTQTVMGGGEIAPTETVRYRKDGSAVDVVVAGSPILVGDEFVGAVAVYTDISVRKQMEEALRAMALVDDLTGLYNRRGFLILAEQQLKMADRVKGRIMLLFADLNGLKWINDTLGHLEGDQALIEVTDVLRETFRESDIVARFGGDEFVVLAIETNGFPAEVLTSRLQHNLEARNAREGRRYKLSLSMGIAHYDPEHPCSIDDLLARADRLMYEQKRANQKV